MSKIEINNCVYHVHPIYDLCAADKDGNIIHTVKQTPMKGNDNTGYLLCGVRKQRQKGYKTFLVHRFIWECHNGIIPKLKVIDHINDIKYDNRLCNLQLMTQQENCKKSVKNREYSFLKNIRKNPKCVKAINCNTKEVIYFNSMTAVEKHLGISNATVKRVCDKIYGRKTVVSKKDGCKYKFEYAEKDMIPDNYTIEKSSDLLKR